MGEAWGGPGRASTVQVAHLQRHPPSYIHILFIYLSTASLGRLHLASSSVAPPAGKKREDGMPPTMSAAAASCRLYAPPWPLTCSVLYVIPYVVLLVLNRNWTSRGIEQPVAFCVGTTAEYRNGFGSDYSALTPSITLRQRTCAPVDVLGAQASTRATAPTSATAPTGPSSRRMLRRLACVAQSCSL